MPEWNWWEVQFSYKHGPPADLIKNAVCYTVTVEAIDADDADQDEKGKPAETTHFVESDVFCVVKTATEEPYDAVERAILLLQPRILGPREDVQWANTNC